MAQFKHPNVVKLYGSISRIDPIMIIMEYMDNGSLDRYLQVRGRRRRGERGREREGRGERGIRDEKRKYFIYVLHILLCLYIETLGQVGFSETVEDIM